MQSARPSGVRAGRLFGITELLRPFTGIEVHLDRELDWLMQVLHRLFGQVVGQDGEHR